MTLAERLEQLEQFYEAARYISNRLKKASLWALGFGVVAFGFGLWWRKALFDFLVAPADGSLSPLESGLPIILDPFDGFLSVASMAMKFALVVMMPVFTVGALIAFRPLVSPYWWSYVAGFTATTYASFLLGAAFAYQVLAPVMIRFFFGFILGIAEPFITLDNYMSMLSSLMLYVGLVFETPLVMYLLARYGVISYSTFRKYWKFSIPISILFAIFITPTVDGLTMWLVAAPMMALYQFGLFFAWLAHPEEGNYMWLNDARRLVQSAQRVLVGYPCSLVRWLGKKTWWIFWGKQWGE